jgi:hypothetical protein
LGEPGSVLRAEVERIGKYCRELAGQVSSRNPHEDSDYWYKWCRKRYISLLYSRLLAHAKEPAALPDSLLAELAQVI